MKVKQILTGVELVIADLEVELNGEMRSSHTLCALLEVMQSAMLTKGRGIGYL